MTRQPEFLGRFLDARWHPCLALPFIALSLLVCGGCGQSASSEASPSTPPAGPPPQLVRVGQLHRRTVQPKLTVVGSVVPSRTSIVASGADGQVEVYNAEEGTFVEQGTVLSELKMLTTDLGIAEAEQVLKEREQALAERENGSRPEEIDEAHARMQAALAAKEASQARLERIQKLIERQASNQDELDEAEERAIAGLQMYLASKATYERILKGPRQEEIDQSRSRLLAQQNQVEYLKAEKMKRYTTAPFDGYVVVEHSHEGQWLSKGDPVATMIDLSVVDVIGNVNQDDLWYVVVGSTAEVVVSSLGNEVWKGPISFLVPTSDWKTGSRAFPVKVRLENRIEEQDGQPMPVLKAGMIADVTFTGKPREALMSPKDALMRTNRGMLVYVCDIDVNDPTTGVVRQVSIQTGLSDGNEIQVIADELAENQFVVVEGAERLRPFQTVRIAPEAEEPKEMNPAAPETKNAEEKSPAKN